MQNRAVSDMWKERGQEQYPAIHWIAKNAGSQETGSDFTFCTTIVLQYVHLTVKLYISKLFPVCILHVHIYLPADAEIGRKADESFDEGRII